MDNNDEYSQSLEEFFAAFEEFDNQLAKRPPPQARCLNRRNQTAVNDEVHCLYRY